MTSPLLIQMMEAAGLALSAWQVRFRGSPALRLMMGPPKMTGSSGGTAMKEHRGDNVIRSMNPTFLEPSVGAELPGLACDLSDSADGLGWPWQCPG